MKQIKTLNILFFLILLFPAMELPSDSEVGKTCIKFQHLKQTNVENGLRPKILIVNDPNRKQNVSAYWKEQMRDALKQKQKE